MLAASLSLVSSLCAAPCPALDSGHSLPGVISPGAPSCFAVTVRPGEPALLTVSQPVDLEIRIEGTGPPRTIDGFDFGMETATLETPGQYRVEVRAVSKPGAIPIPYLMSQKALPLQAAATHGKAEDLATAAKRAGKPENFAAALAAWQQVGDPSAIGRTYIGQGDAAFAAGDLSPARSFYEQAIKTCASIADLRCTAEAANDSGLVAQQLGDFEQSLKRLSEAAGQLKRIGELTLEGMTLSNLGLLFWQTGDYQRAIGYYDQAGGILQARDPLANARVWNNLGLCYQSLAAYQQAGIYFDRALREFTQRHSEREASRARLNLGRTYLLDGKNEAALNALNAALAEAIANSDRATNAGVLNNLGQVLLAEHRAGEAQETLSQALDIHRALGDRGGEAFDLHYLGDAYAAAGDTASARAHYTQAIEIRHACGLRDAESDSLFSLAKLESAAGDRDAGRQAAESALLMAESVRAQVPGAALRASYYARKRRFFDLLVDLDMAPGTPRAIEDGFLAAERGRGRALMDLLAEGTLTHEVTGELLGRRKDVERQFDLLAARLAVSPPAQEAGLRRQVEILVGRDREIEASIRQTFADWKLGGQLGSVAGLQQRYLPRASALLEYHLGETQSYLWLVQPAGIQVFQLPARAEIERQCAPVLRLFADVLGRKRSPEAEREFERTLARLSATLVGPLGNLALPERLILVPDGILTRIPFAALQLPANRRLGLEHDLVQVSSAAYLAVGRKPRPVAEFPRSILAIADPVFSPADSRVAAKPQPGAAAAAEPGLPRIPYSQELDTVLVLVAPPRRSILRGFDANPETLGHLPLGDYALLHFSTHALIDDREPELSRVALSMVGPSGRAIQGFLRPHQLSELPLDGSTVVLSACDTALGKQVLGEGLAGLTTSLFSAGAAQLVLTLSEVDAEGSSEFFRVAYGRVFAPRPEPMEHALTLARRALAKSSRWQDPFYWASFVVYGMPSEARGSTLRNPL